MSARPILLAAVTLSFVAGWAAQAPRTTRYRIESKVEQVIDLSPVGQAEQRNNLEMINFLTITLNDTAGGQTVHAVLDSVTKPAANPLPDQATLDSGLAAGLVTESSTA